MNTILLYFHVLAVQVQCGDGFASAHIEISSPALPGVRDIVWVFF